MGFDIAAARNTALARKLLRTRGATGDMQTDSQAGEPEPESMPPGALKRGISFLYRP